MANTNFSTDNNTYLQLLAGGNVFQIPRFQRDYSWKEEHWEDLWSDILDLIEQADGNSHYMGYLVLQPRENESFDIIDGQQRITTLSLLVLSAMRKLNELISAGIDQENNQTRLAETRRTYIGQLDTVSLLVNAKLSLNRNNNNYYQTYLTTLRDMPSRGFKSSEHSMRKATEWFLRRFEEHLARSGRPEDEHGEEIARVLNLFSRGLFFTVITVDDELNAYKVFETLNARGVKLAAPDLLKNYLFSVISRDAPNATHNEELDSVEQRWSNILERLQSENVTSFLRTYWGAKHSFVRQAELFKVIKRNVENRQQAFELISGLEDGLETYLSLTQPDISGWTGEDKESASFLKMFSVRQPFALLMAAQKSIPTGFTQILKGIVNITFRYNVISNLQAAEQERTYSRVAIGISNGKFKTANDVLSELKSIYPNDEIFRANFSTKVFDTGSSRNKNIVKYVLAKLESQANNTAYVLPPPEISIEHILPENPNDDWPQFDDALASSEVYRIGNMVLLEDNINREIGNKGHEEKFKRFKDSKIASTADIPNKFSTWDQDAINSRQSSMAKMATAIWRVPQLH